MAVALSDDANAQLRVNRNNLNLAGAVNGQNSGDVSTGANSANGGAGGAAGLLTPGGTGGAGGNIGVSGGNFCSQCNAQDAGNDATNTDSQNNE